MEVFPITREILLKVNGKEYRVEVQEHWTLLEVLRDCLGLTGTKSSCNQGECGACTVLVNNKPVLSCVALAVGMEGKEIVTIEGLAGEDDLHPLQRAFVDEGAVQCGFCTPGMIMTAEALLLENPDPSEDDVREAISGNVCRCTGYHKPVKAILTAARELQKQRGVNNVG
ncbi:MAG: (2Fe-2S)-binding protein [Pelotomaculum sp.]|jgi:carbon-monoxide dehydrogenase small subunit